jgi:hypothetical protein
LFEVVGAKGLLEFGKQRTELRLSHRSERIGRERSAAAVARDAYASDARRPPCSPSRHTFRSLTMDHVDVEQLKKGEVNLGVRLVMS